MRLRILTAVVLAASTVFADDIDITTVSGTKYKSVTVTRIEPDAISVTHSHGVARIPFSGLTFEKDGIYLITFFLHGHVGNVTYTRKDKRPFLAEEAEILIENNSYGIRWVYRSDMPNNQNWEAADGSMLAINHSDYSGLVIATREYLNAMKRISADSLKDF